MDTENKNSIRSSPHRTDGSFSEVVKFALIAIIIVLPIRLFVARPFIVSGSSMDPTFKDGQYLIVDQLSYKFEAPHRGDVVIFKYPNDTTKFFIKRVIGLPGETVESKAGKITITNSAHPEGIPLNESYIQNTSFDTWSVSVGQHEYFVMGDNRIASSDSRSWGMLDQKYLVGRPFFRLYPLSEEKVFPGERRPEDITK